VLWPLFIVVLFRFSILVFQGAKENSITEQISYDKLSFRLRSFMASQELLTVKDHAFTVAQLSREFHVPLAAVLYHLNKTPDYYCWKAEGPVRSSFVVSSSLQIYFPGLPVEGCVDGLKWATVLHSFHSGENRIRVKMRQYRDFVHFLERNGVGVSVHRETSYDELICWVGGRYR